MAKTTLLSVLLLTSLLFGCKKKNFKDDHISYRAINGRDTALLDIVVDENHFYGQFEMIYGKNGKDSGAIRGQIYGDTLKGLYEYRSYGGSNSRRPIVFLNRDGKYRLGKGLPTTFVGIPFFVKDVPIDYEIGFVFEEVK
ncbi:hypothetical protein [Flavobacterium soli]|uniref:hypothetical protein n=1 Tax=Flavobacterium soli TaxID=344881 RepID=UPI000422D383|nr:hypothetical protein [Flavobacterium soli]